MSVNTLDEFQLELGNPGRFRLFLFILLTCNIMPVGFHSAFSFFTAFTPTHRCKIPSNWTASLNESIPKVVLRNKLTYDQCSLYANPYNHSEGTIPCTEGWEYIVDEEDERFVSMEWDLVCDRRHLVTLGLTVQFTGVMLGGILFGLLSDVFGRKKVMLTSMIIQAVFNIGTAFVTKPGLFFTCTFFTGFFMQGIHTTSYTMSAELFHPRHRTLQGVFIGFPWSLTVMITSSLFWAMGNWRHVQLFTSLLSLLCILYVWFIPESLRWHVARGDLNRGMKVVEKFAHYNKVTLKSNAKQELEQISIKIKESQEKYSKGTLMDLLRAPHLRKYTLILGCTYFAAAASYMGVSFSLPGLGGNKYISYIISGCLELTTRSISAFIFQRLGRRKPMFTFLTVSGGLFIIAPFFRYFDNVGGQTLDNVAVSFAIIGNLILTMTFSGILLHASEVFPTLLRSVGMGFCTTVGRIGTMTTPQILVTKEIWMPLPMIFYGLMCITMGLSILILPETNKKPLPDAIHEAENLR